VQTAIVGAGLMGRWHATYVERVGARIALVIDRDEQRAAALAARFPGARTAQPEHFEQACAGVNVVHICTPAGSHELLARISLEVGAHVLVEKPLAGTAEATTALLALAAQKNRLLVPVHQFPFQRGMRALVAALPELGDLRQIDFTTFTAGADGRSGMDRREVLLEILPHPVSLLRSLDIQVSPSDWRILRLDDDALEMHCVRGKTSLRVRIDLSARPTCNELRVAGEHGTAVVDLFHGFCSLDRAATTRLSKAARPFRQGGGALWAAGLNLGHRAVRREPAYPGLPQLIDAFYDAVAHGRGAPIARQECIDAAELSDLIAGCRPMV
jgi:predicted dehydrogenase